LHHEGQERENQCHGKGIGKLQVGGTSSCTQLIYNVILSCSQALPPSVNRVAPLYKMQSLHLVHYNFKLHSLIPRGQHSGAEDTHSYHVQSVTMKLLTHELSHDSTSKLRLKQPLNCTSHDGDPSVMKNQCGATYSTINSIFTYSAHHKVYQAYMYLLYHTSDNILSRSTL